MFPSHIPRANRLARKDVIQQKRRVPFSDMVHSRMGKKDCSNGVLVEMFGSSHSVFGILESQKGEHGNPCHSGKVFNIDRNSSSCHSGQDFNGGLNSSDPLWLGSSPLY